MPDDVQLQVLGGTVRKFVLAALIQMWCGGMAQDQPATSPVTGYLFKPDGSPATLTDVRAISVTTSGPSFMLTPIVITTDATGFTSVTLPRLSTLWIAGTAL